MFMYIHVCTCLCVYICMYTNAYVYTRKCTRLCMYIYVCLQMFMCIHVRVCAHVYAYGSAGLAHFLLGTCVIVYLKTEAIYVVKLGTN